MRLALKLACISCGALVGAWLTLSWIEAGKEIRVLCSALHSGLAPEQAVRTLQTGEYLRYRTEPGAADAALRVDRLYDPGSSRCVIGLEAGRVVSSTHD